MFDRAAALAKWRAALSTEARLSTEQIAELEAHVWDTADDIASNQLSEEERLLVATQRLGHPLALRDEYEKVVPWATWRLPIFWAAVGVAWVLGVEAILDSAIPIGAFVALRYDLPLIWLKAWAFVVYVGGPIIAFAAVAAWMRRYSATDPRSGKALITTVIVAILLRIGSVPLGGVMSSAWQGFDARAWSSFQTVWQAAVLVGLLLVAGVAIVAFVRFRDLRNGAISSR